MSQRRERDPDMNYRIRDREVRVIDENGAQLGVMTAQDANRLADSKSLDLVKINAQAVPPVCKIMDYGKFKFDAVKKQKEQRKNQVSSALKEMWLSMNIGQHDLETKARLTCKMLEGSDKVKVSLRMRGREQAHVGIGVEVMNKFAALNAEFGTIDKRPTQEGRHIVMILVPIKK